MKMAKQNGYDKGLRNWKDFDFYRRLICHGPSETTTKSTWKARSWRLKAGWFVWDLIKKKLCSRRNEATGNVCHREIIRFQSKENGKEGLSFISNWKLECELAPHNTRDNVIFPSVDTASLYRYRQAFFHSARKEVELRADNRLIAKNPSPFVLEFIKGQAAKLLFIKRVAHVSAN